MSDTTNKPRSTVEVVGNPVLLRLDGTALNPNDLAELQEALRNLPPGQLVPLDVSGLPEFDRLLTLLQTIYLMTSDDRVRSFIEAELNHMSDALPARPITHTFELLADAQRRMLQFSEEQRTYLHAAATDLSVPISYLDDARQLAEEGTAEYAVLETLQKYMQHIADQSIRES